MALINFSSSSSHSPLYSDHHRSPSNSLSPSHTLQFNLSPFSWKLKNFNHPIKSQPRNSLSSQVSLQDPSIHQESQNPSTNPSNVQEIQNPDGKSKRKVWVNPKNPRGPQLRLLSRDSRYASLVKVAESLNSCNPTEEDVFKVLSSSMGEEALEQDVVIVLNNMENPDTAVLALKYFQKDLKLKREVILYNVTLKVFRKNKNFVKAQSLFDEMLKRGVQPDNITFSTIISCARVCSLPDKAVEYFERMRQHGCYPDDVTYSVMIDAYGQAGNIDMALSLYDRARTEKWRLDLVTFATLIKIYASSGNSDGALNVFEEMKALGVKPNLVIYNTLLDAMGRAKRPWQASSLYKEMIKNGCAPSRATYAALLRAYGRARYARDALNVYREMKEKGLELNATLYNTVISMCADIGLVDEAVEIYEDMKKCGNCVPDSWTYSSLVTIFSCSGNVSEAENTLNQMFEAGFEPNIFVLTSLIQCYGKANQTDNVVKTFDRVLELGISPDDRFCGCLLNVMTTTPKEELGKLIECICKVNPKLGSLVKLLIQEETSAGLFRQEANELFGIIHEVVRKPYCNCLIDLCVNLYLLEKACELLDMGLTLGIYTGIQSKSPTQWSLHLKSLSLGAALTALHVWMNDLSRAVDNGEELPPVLGINTGHGKHKYSEKGLASAFVSHLEGLNSPFHEAPEKVGWFLTTKDAAKSWLESRKLGNESELISA